MNDVTWQAGTRVWNNTTLRNRAAKTSASSDFQAETRHDPSASLWYLAIAAGGLAAAAIVTYSSSFAGVFLFDDRFHLIGPNRLSSLSSVMEALASRRPVTHYSFGLNYAVGAESAWCYHLINLVVQVLAGVTQFGLVRR